jgi:peptidoglycan hydrolase CwlO-like protein
MGKPLSETARLSSKSVKSWLEHESGPLLTPIHSRAQKLLDEMRKTIENLLTNSKMLLDNSQREIEKRNPKIYKRARALNRLSRLFIDRLRHLQVPDSVTYEDFQGFVQEVQKAFTATDIDIRNWFPRVSPFFILDRRKFQAVFERAKELLKELDNFLTREYVKAKTVEKTFQLVDKVEALEQELQNLVERRGKAEEESSRVESEISETRKKMYDLKSSGGLDQLSRLDAELTALSSEVEQSLRHLQKPFVKLQSLALRGEGSGLTPEELSKLNQYVADPFQALATEEDGHPLLRQILEKMNRAISEGKLKLKPEKTRKAEQLAENILARSSLTGLHEKSVKAVGLKKQLSASDEVTETGRNVSKLQEQLEGLERRKRIIEGELSLLERTCRETGEKIRSTKSEIEKNAFDFTNKRVQLE